MGAAVYGRAAHAKRRAAAVDEEAGGGRRKKSAVRKAKDERTTTSCGPRWVRKRSEAAVAAAGGVKLGRVLACIGTFILQLRRLWAARAAVATEEVATGDDVAAATAHCSCVR